MRSDGMRFKPAHKNIFGLDPWAIRQDGFSKELATMAASVFSQGNGLIGMRGGLDEPVSDNPWDGRDAVFLNGTYEYEDLVYTWRRHGLSTRHQVTLQVPDWQYVLLSVNGHRFRMTEGTVLSSLRTLDLRDGVLRRVVEWEAPDGTRVRIESERFVHMSRTACAALSYRVTALNGPAELRLEAPLNGAIKNLFSKITYLTVTDGGADATGPYLELETARSGIRVALATQLESDAGTPMEATYQDGYAAGLVMKKIESGESLLFRKYAGVVVDKAGGSPLAAARDAARAAAQDGWDRLLAEQCDWWAARWQDMDIEIEGDSEIQQGIRFCMMQLLQGVGRDGHTNIGAKAMTGWNYAGKTFWDTEMYMAPFFLNTDPAIGRALIDFRYHTLDKAREHAAELGYPGALFPWETINGEESAFIFEASTAQYHLQAAIGHSIRRYFHATGDWEYVVSRGLEILIETSRVLYSIGAFIPARGGQFCINVVCGPDEYTPCVDNNCYTNVMTKYHLLFALEMLDRLQQENAGAFAELTGRLGLSAEETAGWRQAAEKMRIPYDEERGIHLQDDTFLYRTPMEVEDYLAAPPHKTFPLNQWRVQLLKQADVILLEVVRPLDFDTEQKRRDYEFYEPKTIHESSLSPCCYSIVAQELGILEQAEPYLYYTVRMDLDDYQHTEHGLHAPGMGGAWWALMQGVAGIVVQDDRLHFRPHLPSEWKSLKFKYRFQGSQVQVTLSTQGAVWELLQGNGFTFNFKGADCTLDPKNPRVELKG